MAEFQFEIGAEVSVNGAPFEVVGRSSNDRNAELSYTIVSRSDADARRAAETTSTETPAADTAPAVAAEAPETLLPR